MGKVWEGKGKNGEVKSKETNKGGTFREREKQSERGKMLNEGKIRKREEGEVKRKDKMERKEKQKGK